MLKMVTGEEKAARCCDFDAFTCFESTVYCIEAINLTQRALN